MDQHQELCRIGPVAARGPNAVSDALPGRLPGLPDTSGLMISLRRDSANCGACRVVPLTTTGFMDRQSHNIAVG